MNEPRLPHLHLDHAAMIPGRALPDEPPVWPLHIAMPFILAMSLGLWALIWLSILHSARLAVALLHVL